MSLVESLLALYAPSKRREGYSRSQGDTSKVWVIDFIGCSDYFIKENGVGAGCKNKGQIKQL